MSSGAIRQGTTPGFHVVNIGCKVNRVEADTIAAACLAAGADPVSQSDADVVIVNTCTVTSEADAKTRKAVRGASRRCRGTVIVTGCAASMDPDGLAALGDNVRVLPAHIEAERLAVSLLRTPDAPDATLIRSTSPESVGIRAGEGFKTRMDIKIQDGCDNACTYCIVFKARGPARSIPSDDALSQIARAAEAGVGEVVLAGINVGSYDDGSMRLPQLVQAALDQTSIGRIRISSIEPPTVDEQLVEVLARNPRRLCAHFHVPLQSGCDATLSAMGRTYSTSFFASRVEMIRLARPDAAISTDVIVGFPNESDEQFAESLAFCRAMRFSRMHVFRYSRRPGTPAAEMDGQIDPETKAARSQAMIDLAREMASADIAGRVGSSELALMISPNVGVTESYHEVELEKPAASGELVGVHLVGVTDTGRFTGRLL